MTAVAGDVGTDGLGLDDDARQVLSICDIVIHSAATVSFDSPLDSAVEVNLLGPSRVAAAVVQARADAAEDGRVGPAHFIPVSTAYVAGTHQGEAPEQLLEDNPYSLDVDWRGEVTAARRLRSDADAESRQPKRLASFAKAARGELGGAGIHLLAERAERLREDWVKKQLVDAGKARAAALGWPDAYAYTKVTGRAGADRPIGRRPPLHHRPTVDHRVGPGRAGPRLDPGLSHGRADHRVLRPGLAQGVPGCARRGHRRHPGGSGGGDHHRRCRRTDPVTTALGLPRGLGRPESLPLRPPGRAGPIVVHRPSRLRLRRPAHRGARMVVPRSRAGATAAAAGWEGDGGGRAHRGNAAGTRAPGRMDGGVGGEAPPGRPGARLRGALRRLRRDRGALSRRPPARAVGSDRPRRAGAVLFRSGRDRLGPVRPRHPSPVGGRARPGAHDAGKVDPTGPR